MPIQILMPALSPTMTEGNLARWLKKEGDLIKPGDILAEIETDKATMEIEAIDGGTLAHIFVPEGTDSVPVNTLIAMVLEDGETEADFKELHSSAPVTPKNLPEESKPQDMTLQEAMLQKTSTIPQGQRLYASPLAKRIATQHDLNLSDIQGSGPRGRIIKADVEEVLSRGVKAPKPVVRSEGMPPFDELKLSTMRKVIAKRLTEAKQTVPHFYLTVECRVEGLLACRKELNGNLKEDQKLSVNDFILKATAKALQDVPDANASYTETHIRRYRHVDLSVAVAIEGGLVTPVVRHADALSLLALSQTMKALITKARAGKLTPEDYQGGTFSLSNLGMFGIKNFSAIINPPQGCILAIGAGEERPIVKDGVLSVGTLMSCTLSVDHRVVDGAVGAQFLQAFKKYVENPLLMLI